MFEYKKGDIVRCKRFFKDKNNYIQFYEGSEYKIHRVDILYDTETFPNSNTFSSTYYIEVKSGKLTYRFDKEKFYNHFYSKKRN